jgi:hypothetical protein
VKTISKHWPRNAPRGDRPAICGYCGVQWRRSQLRRDRSGLLACPDDRKGLDVVSLAEGNARLARRRRPATGPDDGHYDNATDAYEADGYGYGTVPHVSDIPDPDVVITDQDEVVFDKNGETVLP